MATAQDLNKREIEGCMSFDGEIRAENAYGSASRTRNEVSPTDIRDRKTPITRIDTIRLEAPPIPARPTRAQLETFMIKTGHLYCIGHQSSEESPLLELLNELDTADNSKCGANEGHSIELSPESQMSSVAAQTLTQMEPHPNNKQDSSSTVVEDGSAIPREGDFESSADDQTPCPVSIVRVKNRKYIGKWQLGRTIGQGSSGKVKIAQHIDTREKCVVKAVRRPKVSRGQPEGSSKLNPAALSKVYKRELYMIREACLGIMLQHPNIARLHSAALGENHFYCFFEHIDGEDLVDHITRVGRLGDDTSRDIFRRVLSAMEYCHRNNVAHRDIKLENIRYDCITGTVKLLDFGFATFFNAGDLLKTNCGSPCYAPPEIYDNREYDGALADVWSLAVCLFGMASGTLPFDGLDFKTLSQKIKVGKVEYPRNFTRDLVNLLSSMLQVRPEKRSTLNEVIRHPWTNYGYKTLPIDHLESDRIPGTVISAEWVAMLKKASVPQAGFILMEELEDRIPSRSLKMETPAELAEGDNTDEDDSNEESEANRFISKMTIEDKPGKKIWWKQLWKRITRANFSKVPRSGDLSQNVRISARDLDLQRPQPIGARGNSGTASPKANHIRRLTEAFRAMTPLPRHFRALRRQ